MSQKEKCCEECKMVVCDNVNPVKQETTCECECHSLQKESELYEVSKKLLYVIASRLDMRVSVDEYNKALDDAIEEAVSNRENEIAEEVEKIIQEERFSGAPYALNEVLKIIRH